MDTAPIVKSNGSVECEVRRNKVFITYRDGEGLRRLIRYSTLTQQRHPTEKPYYIAKELLMTERTYKKDLEVIDLVT